MRSDYTVLGIKNGVIYIEDLNLGGKSVTNDAENVVKAVVGLLGNKPINYKDSEGVWCELLHDNGVFIGFGVDHACSRW